MNKGSESARFCSRCGAELRLSNSYCSQCGSPVRQGLRRDKRQESTKTRELLRKLREYSPYLGLLAIVFVMIGLAIVVNIPRFGSEGLVTFFKFMVGFAILMVLVVALFQIAKRVVNPPRTPQAAPTAHQEEAIAHRGEIRETHSLLYWLFVFPIKAVWSVIKGLLKAVWSVIEIILYAIGFYLLLKWITGNHDEE